MNKRDIIFIITIILVSVTLLLITINSNNSAKEALVYYNNDLIKTIDLSINDTYSLNGYNGEVVLEVLDSKIRVVSETSPLHLCSKQGFISASYESIICLPNKIVINISDSNELDGVVK